MNEMIPMCLVVLDFFRRFFSADDEHGFSSFDSVEARFLARVVLCSSVDCVDDPSSIADFFAFFDFVFSDLCSLCVDCDGGKLLDGPAACSL